MCLTSNRSTEKYDWSPISSCNSVLQLRKNLALYWGGGELEARDVPRHFSLGGGVLTLWPTSFTEEKDHGKCRDYFSCSMADF